MQLLRGLAGLICITAAHALKVHNMADLSRPQQNSSHGSAPAEGNSAERYTSLSDVDQIWLLGVLAISGCLLPMLMHPCVWDSKYWAEPQPAQHLIQEDVNIMVRMKNTRFSIVDSSMYYLINASWQVLVMTLFEIYLLVIAIFAGLFMLQDGSVSGGTGLGRFANALNLSAQTFATIGYGKLLPATEWGNTIVFIESYVSMVMIAIGGGILFSRVNRSASRLALSDIVVVDKDSMGQVQLSLRMLNQRPKSSWMDVHASISVWIQEGSVRRLSPLKLLRDWHPILHGSWMLRHVVDESSPLHGLLTDTKADERILSLVVFIKGTDATYHDMLYANQVYYTKQFAFGCVFTDMIEFQSDEIVFDPLLLSATEEKSGRAPKYNL